MKKSLIITLIVVGVLIIGFFVLSKLTISNSKPVINPDVYEKVSEEERNLVLESQLTNIISQEVINKNFGLSINYSLVFSYDNSGLVFINCEKPLDFVTQEQIVSNLVNKIPEGISRTDIHLCEWSGWTIENNKYNKLM